MSNTRKSEGQKAKDMEKKARDKEGKVQNTESAGNAADPRECREGGARILSSVIVWNNTLSFSECRLLA